MTKKFIISLFMINLSFGRLKSETKFILENKPKVSIITSVYNGDQYIEEFLKDITRQTIFDQCELIMINTGSPGNEEPIIKKYMKSYPNIRYKKFGERLTIYRTWNLGIQFAKSDVLTNANLDDRRAPNSLEEHLKALEENPTADLVYADYYVSLTPNENFEMYDNLPTKRISERHYPSSFDNIATIMHNPEFSYQSLLVWNMAGPFPMWRKSIHAKFGLFRDDFVALGDQEMWLRAAKGGAQFKKIHKTLDLYYLNPKGLSTDLSSGRVLHEMNIINQQYR